MELPGQFSPESADGQFSFNIGDENFGFEGKFTKGEFVGKIRGGDGKEFTGLVEDLGGGRHRIIDFEGNRGEIESLAEVGQTESAAPAEMSIRLEDAAALAAIDAAPVEEETAAVSTQLVAEAELPTEVVQPPALELVAVELPATPAPEPEAAPVAEPAEVPEKASKENRHPLIIELQQKMQSVSRPLRAVRLWAQAEGALSGLEKTSSKGKIRRLVAEGEELKKQAKEFYPEIEKMTDAEKGKLSRKIVPLSAEGTTEAIRISSPRHREDMAVFYETELQKWENILRDTGDFEQYRTGRAEVESQKNMAMQIFSEAGDKRLLDQAIARIEQKGRGRLKELEARLPRRLLELAGFIPSESPTLEQVQSDMDLRLAYNRVAQQLYPELMGQPQVVQPEVPPVPVSETVLPPESMVAPMVTEPEVVEQQPVEATAPPVPEESAAPAPVEVSGTGAAAGGLSGYQLLEGEQKDGRLLGRFRDPSGQVWEGIAQAGPDGKVTIKGALTEETEAPEPVEASMPGEVVVDIDEQARAAAAKPVEVVEESQGGVVINEKDGKFDVSLGGQTFGGSDLDHTILFLEGWINNPSTRSRKVEEGQVVEALSQLNIEKRKRETAAAPVFLDEQITAPMPDMSGAEIPTAPAEMPAQPEVELTPDQIRERAERRRNNFASAVAQLEGAYMDTVGTKNERVGRVVEGVREMILAGLELAEEGGAAQEVVMNVLGRLNNEQNRPLVQAAAGQAPEQVERAVGEMLQARGAFGLDGKPKSRKELEDSGLVGLIELLIELGMSFTDASVNAVITEVQSATGAGR